MMKMVVVGGDAERINEARRVLLSEGVTCDAEHVAGYERMQDSLAAGKPDAVLIFCEGDGHDGLVAIRAAHRLVSGPVLAAGEANVALMRDAMRAGAREYLDVKNLRHDLINALGAIETVQPRESKRGRIISVFSPINGSGVTTISLNLAISLLKRQAKEAGGVALVDINPPPSDLSLLLDISPKHTLADVLRNQDRLDRRLMAGAMTPHKSGLQVLPQAGFTDDLEMPPFDISPAVLRQIFVLLRTNFAVAVVDLGHSVSDVQFEAFRLSDVIVLPAVADVPGLRRVRWALDTAESVGISRERFQIVVNRHGAKNSVPNPKVEDALHSSIATTIADQGPTFSSARNEGVPAIELSGSIASAFNTLVKIVESNATGVKV